MAIDVHPDLQDVALALVVADIDYEENKGSSSVGEFAERARQAQRNYREAKAELEKKLGYSV